MANPIIAAVLSLIIPGLGQVYAGQFKRGAVIFIAVVAVAVIYYYIRTITTSQPVLLLMAVVGLAMIIAYVYDAYRIAKGT
ncbi:hypothetical protein MmiHf6_08530 [Methanimicrococcus hongohii]|uniref:DUF5683 domain-containing protein n=1 Tax=Methanimicrococcus hongohii TaxID=3028295 RepID=A0AA96UZH1_9EURY|nr:hypothetical protein [Methanimicrococcus sp. Hf6]WNY23544.1 hypothetical protein MmiHf6_08530 [Methanimicrococcus sp. Hf6]